MHFTARETGRFRLADLLIGLLSPGISGTSRQHLVDQPLESRPKVGEGPWPVAELVLDQRAQLAEGLVIFGNQKERVVAEACRASWLADDPAAAGSFGFKANLARGIGNRQRAAERRPSPLVRDMRKGLPAACGCSRCRRRVRRHIGPRAHRRRLSGHQPPVPNRRPEPNAQARASSLAFLRALPAKVSRSRLPPERPETRRATDREAGEQVSRFPGGRINSAISRHFLVFRDPRTRTRNRIEL